MTTERNFSEPNDDKWKPYHKAFYGIDIPESMRQKVAETFCDDGRIYDNRSHKTLQYQSAHRATSYIVRCWRGCRRCAIWMWIIPARTTMRWLPKKRHSRR